MTNVHKIIIKNIAVAYSGEGLKDKHNFNRHKANHALLVAEVQQKIGHNIKLISLYS